MYTNNQTHSFNFKAMATAFMAVAVLFCFGRLTGYALAQQNTQTGQNVSWLLQVNTKTAVKPALQLYVYDMHRAAASHNLKGVSLLLLPDNQIAAGFDDNKNMKAFENLLKQEFKQLNIITRDQNGLLLILGLTLESEAEIQKMALAQTVHTLTNRISQLGLSEASIKEEEAGRIAVNVKNVPDVARLKNALSTTAMLEFKIVVSEVAFDADLGSLETDESLELVYNATTTAIDPSAPMAYLVRNYPVLTGAYIENAQIRDMQPYTSYGIAVEFNAKGAQLFEEITSLSIGSRLAIILDGKVISAPIVQEKIGGGQAMIMGDFTQTEAEDLAAALKAGALPAQITVLKEQIE